MDKENVSRSSFDLKYANQLSSSKQVQFMYTDIINIYTYMYILVILLSNVPYLNNYKSKNIK